MVDSEPGQTSERLFDLREVVIEVDGTKGTVPRIVFDKTLATAVRTILLNDRHPLFERDVADLDEALLTENPRVHLGIWTVHALKRAGVVGHSDLPSGYLASIIALEQVLPAPSGETPG